MHLLPTQEEIVQLLEETGALREGHFEYPSGLHSRNYLQVALAMRYYHHQRTLSVALSRLVRANLELHAMIPKLSIVAPATGGLPVAYGVCEALEARLVYWGEKQNESEPMQFRQHMFVEAGEKVLLVDDILRTGRKITELMRLVASQGGEVVGLAVVVYQPTPWTPDFKPLPFFHLVKLDGIYYTDAAACELCRRGAPLEKVWV